MPLIHPRTHFHVVALGALWCLLLGWMHRTPGLEGMMTHDALRSTLDYHRSLPVFAARPLTSGTVALLPLDRGGRNPGLGPAESSVVGPECRCALCLVPSLGSKSPVGLDGFGTVPV
ncbi:MAG: hypothetical protein ACKOBI_01510, partial [Bacteroidota bacterium]